MSERITKGSENDYHPVNQYIDEQSKLRRARSFWINAKSWALILIAIGLLAVLLAWAYSLLDRYYVLKRVAGVQEKVIEEKVEQAIAQGDQAVANEAFKTAQSEMMRGVTKGVLHKNSASRKIARLNSRIREIKKAS